VSTDLREPGVPESSPFTLTTSLDILIPSGGRRHAILGCRRFACIPSTWYKLEGTDVRKMSGTSLGCVLVNRSELVQISRNLPRVSWIDQNRSAINTKFHPCIRLSRTVTQLLMVEVLNFFKFCRLGAAQRQSGLAI